MCWSRINLKTTTIILTLENALDYGRLYRYEEPLWQLHEEPEETKKGQELIRHALSLTEGDLYEGSTGFEILGHITREIEKQGLGAVIETHLLEKKITKT